MKLEVGMYVRTKRGQIGKITTIGKDNVVIEFNRMWQDIIYKENIIKSTFNIIDILEEGDYVNGSEVLDFEYKIIKGHDNFTNFAVVTENCYLENTDSWIMEKDIKSVITHEQMEQMAYKLGE